MKLTSATKLRLNDPLSEVARRERKYLLGLSVLALIISKAGAIPNKLSAFDVEFTSSDQQQLLFIFLLVLMYYLVAFGIYALSDFLSWRLAFIEAYLESRRNPDGGSDEFHILIDKEFGSPERMTSIMKFSGATSLLRVVLEFVLPIVFGLYAAWSLFTMEPNTALQPTSALTRLLG